ncbi:hypothetical protein CR513_44624, partial [Mucuna pruriens]
MKAWSLVLSALAFTLLLLSLTESEAKAEVYSLPLRVRSSSHQAFKHLRAHTKYPSKQDEEKAKRKTKLTFFRKDVF